jgi:hypothetical protein
MKNLVLIGNGFDLAHNLKTSYRHFISDIKDHPEKYTTQDGQIAENKLLNTLTNKEEELWSDIESVYYQILNNLNNKSYLRSKFGEVYQYDSAKELNSDFDEIKKWLAIHLEDQQKDFKQIENYTDFFKSICKQEAVILNFNYTNTVKEYIKRCDLNIDVIHIHGELNCPENPIIFGFAASNEESKKLLAENDNNYVQNIKKFNYLYTNNEDRLKAHLKSKEFNLFILGHSCGISDKLILSQILNHEGIVKIYPFYFKNRMGYFETMVNIDRIIDDYSKTGIQKTSFHKLVSFPNAYPMPQTYYDYNFSKYFNEILRKKLPQELAEEESMQALSIAASMIP